VETTVLKSPKQYRPAYDPYFGHLTSSTRLPEHSTQTTATEEGPEERRGAPTKEQPIMLTSEAQKILQTIERRLRPSKAPFAGDTEAFNDWTQLLVRFEHDIVAAAFMAHREAGNARWPDYYTFQDLLKRARSQAKHPSNTSEGCQACNDTGWQTPLEDEIAATLDIAGKAYTYCQPCTCPAGQQAERTDLWRKAPGLCHACKGAGWFNHRPDEVERCTNCGGSGIERP